jgi:hypothetical protein
MAFDASQYGQTFAGLLGERRLNPLDGGRSNDMAKAALDAITVEMAFEGQTVVDPIMAEACLSAAWLYHNYLDESHTISQGIDTPTGSYWHGIMHRREPDFSNSKYWFNKVGSHPVFPELGTEADGLVGDAEYPATTGGSWASDAFVDACEAALSDGTNEALCKEIQLREFELLFDYSYLKATGG